MRFIARISSGCCLTRPAAGHLPRPFQFLPARVSFGKWECAPYRRITFATMPPAAAQSTPDPSEPSAQPAAAEAKEEAAAPLPPLSAKEFRVYNRLAEHMDQFHTHFRHTYTTLTTACDATQTKKLPPKALIARGLEFCHHLTMHHTIEERHIFPVLARRMPEFRRELSLVGQHKVIHRGMDALEAYLEGCRRGERDLERGEVRRLLEGFGAVLFAHLDEEVEALRAENMRRYWSEKEMGGLPM